MKALNLNFKSFLLSYNLDYYKIIAIFRIAIIIIAIVDFASVFYDLDVLISENSILPWKLGLLESEYYIYLKPVYTILYKIYFYITQITCIFPQKKWADLLEKYQVIVPRK